MCAWRRRPHSGGLSWPLAPAVAPWGRRPPLQGSGAALHGLLRMQRRHVAADVLVPVIEHAHGLVRAREHCLHLGEGEGEGQGEGEGRLLVARTAPESLAEALRAPPPPPCRPLVAIVPLGAHAAVARASARGYRPGPSARGLVSRLVSPARDLAAGGRHGSSVRPRRRRAMRRVRSRSAASPRWRRPAWVRFAGGRVGARVRCLSQMAQTDQRVARARLRLLEAHPRALRAALEL